MFDIEQERAIMTVESIYRVLTDTDVVIHRVNELTDEYVGDNDGIPVELLSEIVSLAKVEDNILFLYI